MFVSDLVRRHSHRPEGFVGRVFVRLMSRRTRPSIEWATGIVNAQPTDHVLDVGFGGGLSIRRLTAATPDGFVAGVDLSEDMVEQATARMARAIAAGRVEVRAGDVLSLPYPDDRFDKASAINTVYVWPDPLGAFRELQRVLKPGGRVFVAFPPLEDFRRMRSTRRGFSLHDRDQLERWLADAGFRDLHVDTYDGGRMRGVCLSATK